MLKPFWYEAPTQGLAVCTRQLVYYVICLTTHRMNLCRAAMKMTHRRVYEYTAYNISVLKRTEVNANKVAY